MLAKSERTDCGYKEAVFCDCGLFVSASSTLSAMFLCRLANKRTENCFGVSLSNGIVAAAKISYCDWAVL